MSEPREHVVDRVGRRIFGAIIGLVLGLLAGVLFELFVLGWSEAFLLTVAAAAVAGAVIGYLLPRPFLFLGELLLSIFSSAA